MRIKRFNDSSILRVTGPMVGLPARACRSKLSTEPRNVLPMTEPQSTAQAAAHHPGFTPDHPSRSHWVAKTLIALVVLVLLVVIVRAIDPPKAKRPAPAAIPVVLAPARIGTLDVYLDAIGTVTPVYTDTIVSRVAGMITDVHFKEGQIVKKDDLLAVIDPRP